MFTENDFKNARFAEHPDGSLALRGGRGSEPWTAGEEEYSDRAMAQGGWIPVIEAPRPSPVKEEGPAPSRWRTQDPGNTERWDDLGTAYARGEAFIFADPDSDQMHLTIQDGDPSVPTPSELPPWIIRTQLHQGSNDQDVMYLVVDGERTVDDLMSWAEEVFPEDTNSGE